MTSRDSDMNYAAPRLAETESMETQISCVHTKLALSQNDLVEVEPGAVELPGRCRGCETDLTAEFEGDDAVPSLVDLSLETDSGLTVRGRDPKTEEVYTLELTGFRQ